MVWEILEWYFIIVGVWATLLAIFLVVWVAMCRAFEAPDASDIFERWGS